MAGTVQVQKPAQKPKGAEPQAQNQAEATDASVALVAAPATAQIIPARAVSAAGAKAEPEPEVSVEEIPPFAIDIRPRILKLPDIKYKTSINVRYPLLPPYAFAHVYWDEEKKELVYNVEEYKLTDTETELLKLIQLGLEEMINISFMYAAKSNLILKYLEKNVQSILLELGAKVSRKSYMKIMYYIYRDFIGLNEIEPLLNDYYIEDIECNGVGSPVYIVHRKYQNMRTNIIYQEPKKLIDFVEKLAQKTGRYVSFAKPLLDGTLPDGSRVNATYTSDVTTHGPTFTIRKFTKEPLTPVHLIGYGTASPELFAYFWLVVEHKFNIMVIGETASGKTTFLNCVLQFVPTESRIVSIEDTRELSLAHENWIPSVSRSGFGIPNILGKQYGEVTLFDLLKETFRQNPDYVVVGEVRGKETYVLFQGMASIPGWEKVMILKDGKPRMVRIED
ncbi:type II/IV secretion system ATPase subunit, partial [Candidatus Woesearchaeota archaeon]|nr:type II/IV secretion system ATPase subunit [Candidatus Woesearchaeota archaeon]